ncbi:DUF4010 domain-containing protein [Candidatus Obscuribacterales bacterium]|nr:DUF4010 domain-containing protein [Candidatus Obscuribacterales bacterium]MBX3149345.1 DUF4010 domain-containing protein [Candidatus Obscuribacterales bacterium]
MPPVHLHWIPIIEALLIGILVGAQREAVKPSGHIGVREFVTIAIIGSLCGMLENNYLTASAVVSILVYLTTFRFREKNLEGSGFTTDLAILAVFCLSFAGSSDDFEHGQTTAIGLSIILTLFLEAKDKLQHFFRETITTVEFSDTLRFLALIFIIYPLLPSGDMGPFDAFNFQRIWMFVILVSSVSFVGYFFEKFLGQSIGIKLTAILGGLASTTATTQAFSRDVKDDPAQETAYWQATVLANAVQFPRILAFLSVVAPKLAVVAAWPLIAAGGTGFAIAALIRPPKSEKKFDSTGRIELGNPFTLGPALKFGAVLAVIIFLTKAATVVFGTHSLIWTSCIGGMMDVDAIAVTVADLFHWGKVDDRLAITSMLLATLMNAIFKTATAFTSGTQKFGLKVGFSFVAMFAAAFLTLLLHTPQ